MFASSLVASTIICVRDAWQSECVVQMKPQILSCLCCLYVLACGCVCEILQQKELTKDIIDQISVHRFSIKPTIKFLSV